MVDTVILLDGLHTGYQGDDLDTSQLAPFVEFARNCCLNMPTIGPSPFMVIEVRSKMNEQRMVIASPAR